jgi:hypothetical protein
MRGQTRVPCRATTHLSRLSCQSKRCPLAREVLHLRRLTPVEVVWRSGDPPAHYSRCGTAMAIRSEREPEDFRGRIREGHPHPRNSFAARRRKPPSFVRPLLPQREQHSGRSASFTAGRALSFSNWLIISFSQRTVDHGLPARFNGARSPDPSVKHFLGWLPHRCDGSVGQSECCRFIKWSSPHFLNSSADIPPCSTA